MGKMEQEKETQVQGGRLTFEVREGGICIKSCKVISERVIIPPEIENTPVTAIGRKAFLSCKNLREIWLPERTAGLGDWAFAYCSNLETIHLPRSPLSLGKDVFKECKRLSRIALSDLDGQSEEGIGALLGAAVMKLEALYLFAPQEVGSRTWFGRFDDKLREFLAAPDEDGFVKMVYCGEEDIVANVEFYLAERRREKARLCFLRLICDDVLSPDLQKELAAYLAGHTKGCESEAAWEVVFKEHGSERAWYEAFVEAGCLTGENCDEILTQMGESFPEMKAWLMRWWAGQGQEEDFFAGLTLD